MTATPFEYEDATALDRNVAVFPIIGYTFIIWREGKNQGGRTIRGQGNDLPRRYADIRRVLMQRRFLKDRGRVEHREHQVPRLAVHGAGRAASSSVVIVVIVTVADDD